MNKAEIVEEMLGILDSPEKWCKFLLTNTTEDGVEQFCLMGALNKVVYNHAYMVMESADMKRVSEGMQLVDKMDELAIEKGYVARWSGITAPLGSGAHAVDFNNAVETEYEDLRLFLKETLEAVS